MTEEKPSLLKKSVGKTLKGLSFWTSLILILAIMVMSACGALMIRLQKGPLDLDFAKKYIEQALSDTAKGYEVKIGAANLIWPEVAEPMLIDVKDVQILQGKGESQSQGLSVNEFAFSLSSTGLLRGKILPSQIIINNPDIKILNEDGSFNSFNQVGNLPVKEVYGPVRPKELRDSLREFLTQIVDPKNAEIKTLAALTKIQIKNASLQNFKSEELANLNLTLEKHDLGIAGGLVIAYPATQEKEALFKSSLLYRTEQEDLTFTADLKDLHTSHVVPFLKDFDVIINQDLFLNGDVKAAFNKELKLQSAMLDINIPTGKFHFPDSYDEDLIIKDFITQAYFNRDTKQLEVRKLSVNLAGIPIEASLTGVVERGHLAAPLDIKISKTTPEALSVLLPRDEKKSALGEWIGKKLNTGTVSNVHFTTQLDVKRNRQTRKWDLDVNKPKMTYDFANMTVAYSPTLAPVKNSTGSGTYENDALLIKAKSGTIYDVAGNDVTVKISNLSVKGSGLAEIDINANGPLQSALRYVSDEPINAGKSLGFDTKKVKGDVKFNVKLNFPTLKNLPKESVNVSLQGTATNLELPNVVRGLPLKGGPYDLTFKDGAISLKGKGKLGTHDIDLDWMQYMDAKGKDFETKITAKITADAALRKTFGIGLTDYLSGPLPVDVTYLDKGIKATIDVKGDLTQTVLKIDPFQYSKPAGVAGDLSLKALVNVQDLQEVDSLNIKTKDFQLSNGRLIFKKLKDGSTDIAKGDIPSVTLGKTKAKVSFENLGNNTIKAVVDASVVDATNFIKPDKARTKSQVPVNNDGQAMQLSLDAKRMVTTDDSSITDVEMYLELNKSGDPTRIEMDANVGSGKFNIRFKPDASGARNFVMNSSDAGSTLKVFGLYDKMRGGSMTIGGKPKQGSQSSDLFGRATIKDFSVKGAPALAKLMSAMSLKGVNGLIESNAVSFTKLQSDFEWKFKEDGNLLVVKEGRTSGNQLGLTFEGFVNMGTRLTDISGTVIPLSSLNKALGKIPVIGDILTGGDALFAATYSMKGPSIDPKVTMNPLSVLAPGFVRKILFESDVDKKVEKEEAK